jgi:hypothetical protein
MEFEALTRAFRKEEALTAWLNKHPHWHAGNLESHEVLVPGTLPIVFVHRDHPSITCLRNSQHLLAQNLDDYPMIEGIYFKLSTALFAACCHAIRTQIYSQPKPVKPKALMKLQRWARAMLIQRQNARRLALAMALHERLGEQSPMQNVDAELLTLIASM